MDVLGYITRPLCLSFSLALDTDSEYGLWIRMAGAIYVMSFFSQPYCCFCDCSNVSGYMSPDSSLCDMSVAEYIYTDTETHISLAEHRIPASSAAGADQDASATHWRSFLELSRATAETR